MRNKDDKNRFEDDGRTFADMSEVDRQTPLGFIRNKTNKGDDSGETQSRPDSSNSSISKKERRYFIFGALAAALLIAAVFIIGLGLTILLLQLLWN